MRHRLRSTTLLFVLVWHYNCALTPVDAPGQRKREGVALLADLKSYSSPDEVRNAVRVDSWQVVDTPAPTRDDSRPRFEHVTIDARTVLCGQVGVLRLQFVNDLLVFSAFTPDSLEECLKQMTNAALFSEAGSDEGDRYFWRGKDLAGKPFIGIRDNRLQKEIDAWIRRYS
jgi:hypothetical protein